jgi:3-keto-5-aminohexanoate cleavage enzyme
MCSDYTDSYKWMDQVDRSAPLIITVAVNGGIQGKEAHERIPETPEDIALETYDAYNAGASIVHIHGRDTFNLAMCTNDPEVYKEINARVRDKCPDIVINNTTGGGITTTMEDRYRCLEAMPELASLNMGPDMSKFEVLPRKDPLIHPHDGFFYDDCVPFTFGTITNIAKVMLEKNIKPEMEIYHPGQYWVSREIINNGLAKPPYFFQFVMGYQASIFPTPWNLIKLIQELPKESLFSVIGIGRFQWHMVTLGILIGGNVRVGLEDNLYLKRGQKLINNAEAVDKVVRIAKELNRSIASPAQTREMLGLSKVPSSY